MRQHLPAPTPVSGSVGSTLLDSGSDFGDSYRIYRACELVSNWKYSPTLYLYKNPTPNFFLFKIFAWRQQWETMVTRATCEFASHLLHQLSHLIVKMHQMLALNEIACLFIHLSLFSYILFLQTMSGGFRAIFICSLGAATLSCSVSGS